MTDGMADRIRECAKMAGSGDELARLSSISRRTLENYLTGESELKVTKALAIATAVGVTLDWLIAGKLPKFAGERGQARGGDAETHVFIPLYDAVCSAGHGSWSEDSRIIARLAFTRESLRRKGLEPSSLSAIHVEGDSMEAVLKDGDTVLIDHSHPGMKIDAIYVIRMDDRLYAKRLQREWDGGLRIISANQAYPPIEVPKDRQAELDIIGKVVWSGGWLI